MPVPGIDYAWSHPDPAAIAAAGYQFTCRYLSRDPTKNLTLGEAQALAAHGVWVVANWEFTAQDALRGRAGGVADATAALAQAKACGMPDGRPIYFSIDWDVTPAQEPTVTAYFGGVDSVLGLAAAGEYAGYYPLRVQRDGSVTTWEWQTAAWSGGQWDARVNIRQTGSTTLGGVQVDTNEAYTDDYGQWMPGRLPFPSTTSVQQQEALPMEFIASVSPDSAHPDDNPGAWLWTVDGTYVGIAGPADLTALETLGVKTINLSFAMHQRLLATQTAPAPAATITGSIPLTLSGTGTLSVGAAG